MKPVTAALAAVLDQGEQVPQVRLLVDWDADGAGDAIDDVSATVSGVTVDRSVTTEYPDAARFVSGNAAATLAAGLAGGPTDDDRRSAAWHYSPANPDSPLYGKSRLARPLTVDAVYDTDAGEETIRLYTGTSRELLVSAGDRSARLAGLDGREQLRAQVMLPGVSGVDDGLSATWVVSYALAACGVYVSPPRMDRGADAGTGDVVPQTRYWQPMHGSQRPFLADMIDQHFYRAHSYVGGAEIPVRPRFVDGPYVLASEAYWRSAIDYWRIDCVTNLAPGGDLFSQTYSRGRHDVWVRCDTSDYTGGDLYSLDLLATNGCDIRCGVRYTRVPFILTSDGTATYVTEFGSALPADGQWHAVSYRWDVETGVIGVTVDGGDPVVLAIPALLPAQLPVTDDIQQASITSYLPIAELQINRADPHRSRPVFEIPFTPDGVLDRSRLELDAILETDAREAWDLITEIAAAEQAVACFDEAGIFRYRTRARLVTGDGASITQTITATGQLTELDISPSLDQVYNQVSVPARQITVQRSVPVLTDSASYPLAPLSTTTLWWTFPDPVLFLFLAVGTDAATPWPGPGDQYGILSARTNADGSGDTVAVTAEVLYWDAKSVRIAVTNPLPRVVYLANQDSTDQTVPAGDYPHCSLLLIGDKATSGSTATMTRTNPASVSTYGPRPLLVADNQWIQDTAVADGIALELATVLGSEQMVITNLVALADPRRQLGDRVRIVDTDGVALDGEYWLSSLRTSWALGSHMQQMSARQAAPALIIDQSLVGGPDLIGA